MHLLVQSEDILSHPRIRRELSVVPAMFNVKAVSQLLKNTTMSSKSEIVWNFALIESCDVGFAPQSSEDFFKKEAYYPFQKSVYDDIHSGDIVWSQCRILERFVREALPEVKHPFVLFVANGDQSFPNECNISPEETETLVNHPLVIHIFALNNDYRGNSTKVSSVPIGTSSCATPSH